MGIFIYLLFVL